MNKVDFSHSGGFPLDQDVLDFLQNGNIEAHAAMFAGAGATPIAISGMVPTITPAGLTDGFFYLNGEIFKFFGGDIGTIIPPSGGQVLCAVIHETSVPLTFIDSGLSHNVLKTRYAAFEYATPSATAIAITTIVPYATLLGATALEPVQTLTANNVGTGLISGTLNFRKNRIANTLLIYGNISSAASQSLPNPSDVAVLFTLPVGYRPARITNLLLPFQASGSSGSLFTDVAGVQYLTSINASISTIGQFQVIIPRPQAGVSGWGAAFNQIIPLD